MSGRCPRPRIRAGRSGLHGNSLQFCRHCCAQLTRCVSTADMLMGSLLNGMLRSAGQWTKLFHEADSRYEFVGVSPVGIDKGLAQAVFDE